MSRTRSTLVGAALALIVAVGCSDSADKAGGTTAPETTAPETTVPDTTVSETTVPDTTADDADGLAFTSDEGGYQVLFPGEPEHQVLPVKDFDIDATVDLYAYDRGAFSVTYYDLPTTSGDADGALKALINGSAGSIGITDVTFSDHDLDGNPGMHGEGVAEAARIDVDAYVVGNRVYVVQFIGEPSVDDLPISVFLRSFGLLEGKS